MDVGIFARVNVNLQAAGVNHGRVCDFRNSQDRPEPTETCKLINAPDTLKQKPP